MTLIFAHRGYSSLYPENTMLAFREAEKVGSDGIELDVQLTKDGEVVVIHDEKVNRTTNGTGFVKDLSYQEIRKLDAGYSNKMLVKKEPIPSLIEVFDWMKTNDMICNIELKNGIFPYEGIEEKVLSLIREYELSDRVIISSFNHYSIIHFYLLAPDIEIAPLFAEGIYMPWVYTQSIRAKGYHPNYLAINEEIIQSSIENGIAVRPYTVNKEEVMRSLFSINCTAIITDDPVKAQRIKKEYRK
jgi:glycerophosphoryl diester phosphodiesterase